MKPEIKQIIETLLKEQIATSEYHLRALPKFDELSNYHNDRITRFKSALEDLEKEK
jgi:hypothetical protein